MLIKKVTFSDFLDEFKKHNRNYCFSRKGKIALFNYLNELGEHVELNIIGICSSFTEFESLTEFNSYYGYDFDTIEEINLFTTVIKIDDEAFIIRDF